MPRPTLLLATLVLALAMALTYGKPALAFETDSDGDGLSDQTEITIYHTDPAIADTDGDSYLDGAEVAKGYSPLAPKTTLAKTDTDKDGLSDDWEIKLDTDLTNPDTDGDSYTDGKEVLEGYSPNSAERERILKLITVNLKQQQLTYSFGTTTLGSFPISGGLKSTPTPVGSFSVLKKVPVKHYGGPGYDLPNTKWNLHFTTKKYGYYIHGAYWHNDFGKPKSHGCVNVSYANMEALYNWAQVGTKVTISS